MTRFCLIGPTYPYRGGIAHYTTLLARHLREEGHEVLLLSFSRQYPGWLFPGKSDKDPSKRPLRAEAEYILDPINPLTWRRAWKRIGEWRPDTVIIPWWHPYFAPAWLVLSRRIKRLSPAPRLIFICHNVLPHEQGRFSKFILPAVIKVALGRGVRFIVHSQADGDILRALLPQARYTVTPLPTYAALGDGDTTAVELPVSLPDDRPLLLFAGFVRPYKGLDILLDALPLVLAEMPVHLLVAGEFWQGGEAQYRRQIRELGIEEHVSIINEYLPDELLAACIDRADVVVLPYRSATQSAIIQAAFGRNTPVITTDVGGLAEVVEDGRTGLVVPPEDPNALTKMLHQYFTYEIQATLTANIACDKAQFSWQKLIKQIKYLSN